MHRASQGWNKNGKVTFPLSIFTVRCFCAWNLTQGVSCLQQLLSLLGLFLGMKPDSVSKIIPLRLEYSCHWYQTISQGAMDTPQFKKEEIVLVYPRGIVKDFIKHSKVNEWDTSFSTSASQLLFSWSMLETGVEGTCLCQLWLLDVILQSTCSRRRVTSKLFGEIYTNFPLR